MNDFDPTGDVIPDDGVGSSRFERARVDKVKAVRSATEATVTNRRSGVSTDGGAGLHHTDDAERTFLAIEVRSSLTLLLQRDAHVARQVRRVRLHPAVRQWTW